MRSANSGRHHRLSRDDLFIIQHEHTLLLGHHMCRPEREIIAIANKCEALGAFTDQETEATEASGGVKLWKVQVRRRESG